MELNRRRRTMLLLFLAGFLLLLITVGGVALAEKAVETDFTRKNLPPCLPYLFGTDWMGRDMFARTLAGLSVSIRIGLLTAGVSAVIALALGVASATLGKTADALIGWLVDLVMGIPHILLLILISIALGRGFPGVVVGISLTHWTSLARVIRGEVLQLRSCVFVRAAEKLGVGKLTVARRHMLPHLFPQFITGLILQFPHAILHEASITFLGFGLSPEQPAIGIILSESMKYLAMGKWWLAVFPGLALVLAVMLFSLVGENLRRVLDSGSAQE